MSRLADAESKLAAALEALEAAVSDRGATPDGGEDRLDRQAVLAEIGRIDGQIAGAMKAIETAQRSNGSEGGTA